MRNLLWLIALLLPGIIYAQVVPYFPPPGLTYDFAGNLGVKSLTSAPSTGNGVSINQATGTAAGLRVAGAAGDAASIVLIDGGTGNTGWVTLSGNPSAGVFALYDQTTAKYLMQGTTAGVPEFPNVASATGATSGYVCFTSSTGAISYDPTNTCLVSSDEFKEDVTPLEGGLAEIERMQPVSFRYKPGDKALSVLGVQLGFTAESIAAIDPRLAAFDPATGKPRSVQYDRVTVVLALAIQEQQREIKVLYLAALGLIFWCAFLTWRQPRGIRGF